MNYSLKRIIFAFVLGLFVAAFMTEAAYFLLKRENRSPTTIEVVIPVGTAQLMRQGKNPEILSNDMRFVVGDILKVVNDDVENHQFGP